jgi:predicted methyltransferase
MKFGILAGALAAGALLASGYSAAASPAAGKSIADAVANPSRSAADKALDAQRKPAEIMKFIHLKAGEKIVDVFPGPYWDRMFSDVVGPDGKVYMFAPTEIIKAENIKPTPVNNTQPFPDHPNITVLVSPVNAMAIPESVDVVWIRQNYHDLYDPFMGPANVPAFNKLVFNALKKGGLYVIIDHSAPAKSGLEDTNTTHRIDAAVVKLDMAAAGFKFVGESNVLRNKADPRDKLVFDKSIRGKTDQFIYVFRKP